MSELIIQWATLITIVILGTWFMVWLFTISSTAVNKLGRGNIISRGIIIGFSILNAVYNMTLGSLLCLELPKRIGEPSTERLKRYKILYNSESSGIHKWRWNIANGVCRWLNQSDPGHC